MLTDGARGVFGNHLAMRARDEIGDLVTAMNRALRGPAPALRGLPLRWCREIKDAQIDKHIVNRIQAACQPVEDRYRFTGGTELRPRNAMQIRVPLFLFMFAEELPRSFLPLFIARHSPADAVISDELLFGLPITLFMLAGMIVVPLGGGLADRFGARRVFLAGIVPRDHRLRRHVPGPRLLRPRRMADPLGRRLWTHLHRRSGLGRRQHRRAPPRPGHDGVHGRGVRSHHLRTIHWRNLRRPQSASRRPS